MPLQRYISPEIIVLFPILLSLFCVSHLKKILLSSVCSVQLCIIQQKQFLRVLTSSISGNMLFTRFSVWSIRSFLGFGPLFDAFMFLTRTYQASFRNMVYRCIKSYFDLSLLIA